MSQSVGFSESIYQRGRIMVKLDPSLTPSSLSPEQKLLLAIFERALIDYLCPGVSLSQENKRTCTAYFKKLDKEQYGSLWHFCSEFDFCPRELLSHALSEDMKDRLLSLGKARAGKDWNK